MKRAEKEAIIRANLTKNGYFATVEFFKSGELVARTGSLNASGEPSGYYSDIPSEMARIKEERA